MTATLIGEKPGKELGLSSGEADATRYFKVQSDDRDESEYAVISAAGVVYGSAHPDPQFAGLLALDFFAKQDAKDWSWWIVTVEYRTPEGGVATEELNPLLRPADISYDTETTIFVAPGTVDNTTGLLTGVYANSAGEAIKPPPEEELDVLVIDIQRFEPEVFSVNLYRRYNRSLNSDTFIIGDEVAGPGQAKLRIRIGPTREWSAAGLVTRYRAVQYQIKLHPITWDLVQADAGSYYIDESTGETVAFQTKKGNVPFIGFLGGDGHPLANGEDPVFLTFERPRLPFSVLNLPPGP